jgi:hypothetical protein
MNAVRDTGAFFYIYSSRQLRIESGNATPSEKNLWFCAIPGRGSRGAIWATATGDKKLINIVNA